MRKIATVLLALVLGLSLATAVRAYDPPAPAPGSGINVTVHDLGTAHNGMSYVADPGRHRQQRHAAEPHLHLLPRAPQHLSPESRQSRRPGRHRTAGARCLRLPAAVEP